MTAKSAIKSRIVGAAAILIGLLKCKLPYQNVFKNESFATWERMLKNHVRERLVQPRGDIIRG
jgi:hypothetical protein